MIRREEVNNLSTEDGHEKLTDETLQDKVEYNITDAAGYLDRSANTLRSWEYNDMLPKELRPSKNGRGWRVYTGAQLRKIKRWLEGVHPGSGLPHYKPTAEKSASHVGNIRRAKRSSAPEPVA
jgi:hypothetical protein